MIMSNKYTNNNINFLDIDRFKTQTALDHGEDKFSIDSLYKLACLV